MALFTVIHCQAGCYRKERCRCDTIVESWLMTCLVGESCNAVASEAWNRRVRVVPTLHCSESCGKRWPTKSTGSWSWKLDDDSRRRKFCPGRLSFSQFDVLLRWVHRRHQHIFDNRIQVLTIYIIVDSESTFGESLKWISDKTLLTNIKEETTKYIKKLRLLKIKPELHLLNLWES